MKPDARILKFQGMELTKASDIAAVEEALMTDLVTARITPTEARKIQKEVNAMIEILKTTMKVGKQFLRFQRLTSREKSSKNARPHHR